MIVNHERNNYKTLDKIDFLPYIDKFKGQDIHKMVDAINNDYNHTEITDNEWCEGYIFNWISVYELIDYIKKRYNDKFNIKEEIKNIIC
jgi:predicted HTH transcriptional regulator